MPAVFPNTGTRTSRKIRNSVSSAVPAGNCRIPRMISMNETCHFEKQNRSFHPTREKEEPKCRSNFSNFVIVISSSKKKKKKKKKNGKVSDENVARLTLLNVAWIARNFGQSSLSAVERRNCEKAGTSCLAQLTCLRVAIATCIPRLLLPFRVSLFV